mmetsp:Transcript_34026/g.59314  ORF Transcript_34026/g.59314 Transcript_34026/m.59314 type:complete len:442 (-) Transcript_34026:15-1340(-)
MKEDQNDFDDYANPGSLWPDAPINMKNCARRAYETGIQYLPVRKGSVSSCAFTLFACCIGIGILALPYTFSQVGVCLGLGLMALVYMLNYYTSQLLVVCSEATGKHSYDELAALCFGKAMQVFTSLSIFTLYYGCLIAFFAVLCELPVHAFKLLGWEFGIFTNEYFVAAVLIFGIILPLSLREGLSVLRYTSTLSFFAVIYLTVVVVINFFTIHQGHVVERLAATPAIIVNFRGFVEAFVIIMFAFGVQLNVLGIFRELEFQSVHAGRSFLAEGFSMVTVLYTIIAVFGYASFSLEYTPIAFPSVILQADYGAKNNLVVFAYFTVCTSVTLASPLIFYPVIESITRIFCDDKQVSRRLRLVIIPSLTCVAFAIAVKVPGLIFVFSIVGSLVNPVISTLPCVFYLNLFKGDVSTWQRIGAGACAAVTVTAGLLNFALITGII